MIYHIAKSHFDISDTLHYSHNLILEVTCYFYTNSPPNLYDKSTLFCIHRNPWSVVHMLKNESLVGTLSTAIVLREIRVTFTGGIPIIYANSTVET
jgi:hypothetical protein